MRILHTADWHLGQSLHGFPREYEHGCFLDWLLDQLEEQRVDALIIAGDVFDGQNPPISALRQLYRFIGNANRRLPGLDMVVIAGNHDSGSRLEAPADLMAEMNVRVIGALPITEAGDFAPDDIIVPLRDQSGAIAARCVAMPYLRPADLPVLDDPDLDPFIEGVRAVYDLAIDAGRKARLPGEALIVTGHCYMTGGALSEMSERRILGGNLHALPVSIFPDDASYVALGHLHRAQAVGGRAGVRYSGSPFPLAVDEETYRHQVIIAEFAEGTLVGQTALPVPRFVEVIRVPGRGAFAEPKTVLAQLRALALDPGLPRAAWPYLEVSVELPEPAPSLRAEIEEVLRGQPVRLVRLATRNTGQAGVLADQEPELALANLDPTDVFRRLYARHHKDDPDPPLLNAFHTLLAEVERDV